MDDIQKLNELLRNNWEAQQFHNLICQTLRNKDVIFSDLVDIAKDWDVFFLPHDSVPGVRWWAVLAPLSADELGKLKMTVICRIILVPLESLEEEERTRKELIYKEFELAHELGHIVAFENDDLTNLLNCPFMRLSQKRVCPYIELRGFEEGIKIFEDVLDRYDKETKTKQKVKKFFKLFYLVPGYRKTFSSDCVVTLAEDDLALKEESDFCPVLLQLKELLTRLGGYGSVL